MAETWQVQDMLERVWGISEAVISLLLSTREQPASPRDAWLRGALYLWGAMVRKNAPRAIEVLLPHKRDPQCASLLGLAYLRGGLSEANYPLGVEALKLSAEAGCAEGLYQLSRIYSDGLGVAKNFGEAAQLSSRAASLCHPGALVETGKREDLEVASLYGAVNAFAKLGAFHRSLKRETQAAYYFRQGYIRGDNSALTGLHYIPLEHRAPWGMWAPDPLMHKSVPLNVHLMIRTVLLMRRRPNSLFDMLTKQLTLDICFWISTHPPKPPAEDPVVMLMVRDMKQMKLLISELREENRRLKAR